MRKAFASFGAALACALTNWPTRAFAKPMPESVPQELARILAAEEFQPRGSDRSLLGRLGEYLTQKFFDFAEPIFNAFSKMLDKLGSLFPSENPFSMNLPEWLQNFFAFVTQWSPIIFKTLLLLSAIYLLTRFLLIPFIQKMQSAEPGQKTQALNPMEVQETSHAPSRDELQSMFQQKDFDRLLVGLRLHLREQLEESASAQPSITDRALNRVLDENIPSKKLFADVASSFELRAFAAQDLPSGAVQQLYEQFIQQGGL